MSASLLPEGSGRARIRRKPSVLGRTETEEFVPVWRSDRQQCDDKGPGPVFPSLGDEAREEGRRGVREESLPMSVAAGRAQGAAPVRDGEGILGFSAGFGETGV